MSTENEIVVEQARLAAGPAMLETVDGGTLAVFHTPTGIQTVDPGADAYANRADRPRRKTGTTVVEDIDSFVHYYEKHADGHTETYVDLDRGVITAVLDAHQGDAPRWGGHRLMLRLTPTEPWKTWAAHDRSLLPQLAFAEHIEDNSPDIAPDPVPAAEMLEIAQKFTAKTSVSYSSGTRLASGDIALRYEETTDASGGAKGQLAVPKAFAIVVAPFDDVEAYKIPVRLRYRIQSSKLSLIYILDRPEDVIRDAVKTVTAKVSERIAAPIMRGAPGT